MPESPCLAGPRGVRGRAAAAALALLVLALGQPARGAVHPVIPRPGCGQPPPRTLVHLEALAPDCRGPLAGARPAPRHLPGRQQHRMRWCNAQARQQQLRGEPRREFIRHCLHRGG